MILDMEAIKLYELTEVIKEKKGEVLDMSTDAVTGCFPHSTEFPFELMEDGINLKGYTYNGESPKYELESKGRLNVEKMSYRRSKTYQHKELQWDKEDPKTNDFAKLTTEIIDSNKSIHIDGRAGTGKSTLIKELQKLIGDKTMYKALAPTNKACRIINGEIIHKFDQFKQRDITR
jgi:ABC-type multidrug transport system fused ATPase/permease subunit